MCPKERACGWVKQIYRDHTLVCKRDPGNLHPKQMVQCEERKAERKSVTMTYVRNWDYKGENMWVKCSMGKGVASGREAGWKKKTSTRDGPDHIMASGKQMKSALRNLTPRRQQHTAPAEAAQTTPWSPNLTNQMELDLRSSSSSSSSRSGPRLA